MDRARHHPDDLSLYVHVPFCVVKCGYCDFNSYEVRDVALVDRFLDALDRELRLVRPDRHPMTVFIGGGTPTFLDEARFARLFEILGAHVDLSTCDEVTIEANPESTTVEKALIARAAGVDRVSIGAQSFERATLRFLDRAHDAERTRHAFAAVRAAGFDNVSLDLMFAVPGRNAAGWERDLAAALELGPDHLSCYNLTFEPGTRLFSDLRRGLVEPTDDEAAREMFVSTRRILGEAGFRAYEISNFAGRGGPCRHNEHYWRQGDYVGVGPGAASHRSGVRSQNLKPVAAWASAVERGLPATAEAETLSRDQRIREALWLGLRQSAGVDLWALHRRLGVAIEQHFAALIHHYTESGLLSLDGSQLLLTEAGVLFADEVGAAFLDAGWHPPARGRTAWLPPAGCRS